MKIDKVVAILFGVGLLLIISGGAMASYEDGKVQGDYVSPTAPYEGRIRIGNLSVIPGIEFREEYDDNIFMGNGSNKTTELVESDWITHLKPSVIAKYDLVDRGALSLGYTGDFAFYNTNQNSNYITSRINFRGDYKAPAGLIVGIGNDYFNGADPYADANLYRLGQKTYRWNDDLQTKVGYEFAEKFRILGYYNFYKIQYEQNRDYAQNYDSNEVGAGAEMRITPLTWAFLRYYSGKRDYTSHPDNVPKYTDDTDASYKWNKLNTGLTWDATAKISGELNLGYQWLAAKNDLDPTGTPYQNNDTWVASTAVKYQITPKTRLGGELFRTTLFTAGNLSEFYNESGFGIGLTQDVLTQGVLKVGGGWAVDQYNQPASNKREDNNYKAFASFDYYIKKWLMVGLEYRYWDRDSNISSWSFTDNRYVLTLGIVY